MTRGVSAEEIAAHLAALVAEVRAQVIHAVWGTRRGRFRAEELDRVWQRTAKHPLYEAVRATKVEVPKEWVTQRDAPMVLTVGDLFLLAALLPQDDGPEPRPENQP